MRWVVVSLVVLVVAAVTASCGGPLFVAGAADGGAVDSGQPQGDTSVPSHDDAALPVDGGDTGVDADLDASDSAADAGDGSIIFSCLSQDASTTLFCADFDHVTTPGSGWTVTLSFAGGTNVLDTVDYRSPPNGYLATTPEVDASVAFAALEETLTSTDSLVFTFSMLMKEIDPSGQATLARLTVGELDPEPLALQFVLTRHTLSLVQSVNQSDGGQATEEADAGGIGTTAWTRVQIVVDRTTTPWTISLLRDGVLRLQTTAISAPTETTVDLQLGVVFVTVPSAGYSAAFDDVLLATP